MTIIVENNKIDKVRMVKYKLKELKVINSVMREVGGFDVLVCIF